MADYTPGTDFAVDAGVYVPDSNFGESALGPELYPASRIRNGVYLAELSVRNLSSKASETLRFSTGRGRYDASGHYYLPRIEQPATYSLSIQAGQAGSGQYGEMTLINVDGALDSLADTYSVDGRWLTLRYGEESAAYSTFTVVLRAMMEGISMERARVSIRLRDPVRLLEQPLSTRVFLGSGTSATAAEGDSEMKDRPWPVILGETAVVAPVLVDDVNLIYAVHPGSIRNLQNVYNKAGTAIDRHSGNDGFITDLTASIDTGTYAVYSSAKGSYLKLASDPAGTIVATQIESISLACGSALSRLATQYAQVLGAEVQADDTAGVTQTASTSEDGASLASSITLASSASDQDDEYTGYYLRLIDSDGVEYVGRISDYDGATRTAELADPMPDLSRVGTYSIHESAVVAGEISLLDNAYDGPYTVLTGTADGGGANTITLPNSASATDDAYSLWAPGYYEIELTGGTGVGQIRQCSDYVGSTRVLTVSVNWDTVPDSSSVFEIRETTAFGNRNAGIGLKLSATDTVRSAMDQVAASQHAWYGFDALGRLRMGLLRAPDPGASVATITYDRLIEFERQTDTTPERALPRWRVTCNTGKFWDLLSRNDLADLGDFRISLTREWRGAHAAATPAIRQDYPLSTDMSIDSFLKDTPDGHRWSHRAYWIATDVAATYSVPRHTVTCTVADPYQDLTAIDIGRVVTLQIPRFGYTNGAAFLVTAIRRDYQRGLIDLTLWGGVTGGGGE